MADAQTAADTRRRWEADELALRQRMRGEPAPISLERVAGRSGIDVFRAMIAGELPRPPIAETLGFILVDVEPGRAVFQGRPSRALLNPLGTVHGGWFATLLDSALGCAVHSQLPAGKSYTTLELKVNIVRPLAESGDLVRAEGQIVHFGRQTATAEARLVGPDGKLYAHGTTTCLVFDTPRAA